MVRTIFTDHPNLRICIKIKAEKFKRDRQMSYVMFRQ